MLKKLITHLLLIAVMASGFMIWGQTFANNANADEELNYTQLRTIDRWTFNEYRYRMTEKYFTLRDKYSVEGKLDKQTLAYIYKYAKDGYEYLPNNLSNKNLYKRLETSVKRAYKYPENDAIYQEFKENLVAYIKDVQIQKVRGSIKVAPKTGNAPLNVTFRWSNIKDPTGSKIESHNYIWWMDDGGKRKILWRKNSLNYTFREEGTFVVFLDVLSSHKNDKGNTDVLPFSSRAEIVVKEKIASLIIKVNSDRLGQFNELKYTPEEAWYGLVFDATSSTPTDGAKFSKTEWDFGNGVTREYNGDPKVERVKYGKEWEFQVKLKLRTNENKTIERKFYIVVHDPIATVKASQEEWFLGDKFTFSAKSASTTKDLTYAWEIIDIDRDKIVYNKNGKLFTYSFKNKGKYNVKLRVTQVSGEVDIDNQIIYINSKAPVANFKHTVPYPNKPNTVLLDASSSYDQDYTDDGKLQYAWIIDGERVKLNRPSFDGSVGYYTFNDLGQRSVVLEVTDPDKISHQYAWNVPINSLLSVDFAIYPRVTQRDKVVQFVADAPNASFYEWDFGDGNKKWGKTSKIGHKYEKSGIYTVKLKVIDSDDNENSFSKKVYIGESNSPRAFIDISNQVNQEIQYRPNSCYGNGAYIVDRVNAVSFTGKESIDITGKNTGLDYSWKLGYDKYFDGQTFNQKFDELGCVQAKLTVKSQENKRTDSQTIWIKVENVKPTITSLDVKVVDDTTDPVIVKVSAFGAKDLDGVIQSYLWYYYTDVDNSPQDFRATRTPNTSFVLPKITGNYYFVAVMKDNNEARVSSEEITGSKYFITLAWDNINTPLVGLHASDTSINIGEEVNFTAKVENILWQNISKKSKYSWDLDGDGFYEKKTTTPEITTTFKKSWEFFSKVKVQHNGFSATKSITINVASVLKPEFEYLSIGNKFVFINNSIGTYDKIEWRLGDGTTVTNSEKFIHKYTDGKSVHTVDVILTEGTKVKKISKKIRNNVKNVLQSRKSGMVLFTLPALNEDKKLIIEKETDRVFVYLGETKGEVSKYMADFDLEIDTNLNGWKDDDADYLEEKKESKSDTSSIIEIKVNEKKYQTVRLMTLDADGVTSLSVDLNIEKAFIEENEMNLEEIKFNWVSEAEKISIERLKEEVKLLPREHRLKAMMYVQKLQEEWFDANEKTRVIIEFEGYISEINASNSKVIYDTLEGLLVQGQEDKSNRNITFNALKNLVPKEIKCPATMQVTESCYAEIVTLLEAIKDNSNVDENRDIGKQILTIIWNNPALTRAQQDDFKAILKSFVYAGVPPKDSGDDKEPVVKDPKPTEPSNKDWFLSLLFGIIKWIGIIIALFVWIVGLFYLYYILANKDDNEGFQDFIINKTSWEKWPKPVAAPVIDDASDILGSLEKDVKEVKDPLADNSKSSEPKTIDDPLASTETKKEEVPAWLKGTMAEEETKTETKSVEKKTEVKTPVNNQVKTETKKEEVPAWLKWAMTEEETKTETKSVEKKTEVKTPVSNQAKTETKKEEVPAWLKWAMTEEETKTETNSVEKKTEVKTPVSNQAKTETKKDDIPDWLKGSLKEETNNSKDNTKTAELDVPSDDVIEEETKLSNEGKETEIPAWLSGSLQEDKNSDNKATKTVETKTEEKSIKIEKEITETVPKSTENNEKSKKTVETKTTKSVVKNVPNTNTTEKKRSGNKNTNNQPRTPRRKVEPKTETVENKTNTAEAQKSTAKKPRSVKKNNPNTQVEWKTTNTWNKENSTKPKNTRRVVEKKEQNSNKTTKKEAELWDDGMTIPDWLKTEDEK